MFAELNGNLDPAWGWQAILFIIAAVSVVASVVTISDRKKVQDRRITMATEFATKTEMERVAGDVKRLEVKFDDGVERIAQQLKESETRIVDKSEERSVALHERLNEFGDKLGEVRGEMSAMRRASANRTGI
jgi:hypothetical protein